MKKDIYILFWLISLPLFSFAQQGNDPYGINNEEDSVLSQSNQTEQDSINVNDSIQQLSIYRETIQSLHKQNESLQKENEKLKDELKSKIRDLNAIDSIVFKQCLIRPLYRRYAPREIEELKHCLNVMNIENTHSEDYNVYYPLLERYEYFNNEIISYLNRQKTSYELKTKDSKLDWPTFIKEAKDKLNRLEYYVFYKDRNSDPWRSITYLDEVIEDFFKQLQSHTLNQDSIQELLNRLTPKS